MNILKNNKGFTLVELLAVIVILAIIILIASNNVLAQMEKARKNALAIEGNTLVNAAKNAYQSDILEGKVTTGDKCYDLKDLYTKGFFSKGKTGEDGDGYSGSVLIHPHDNVVDYSFWISNGSYVFTNAPVGANGTSATPGTSASSNCGGSSSGPTS